MAVEIPAVPEGRTTDNVYLAGGIDDCALCDVTPGKRERGVCACVLRLVDWLYACRRIVSSVVALRWLLARALRRHRQLGIADHQQPTHHTPVTQAPPAVTSTGRVWATAVWQMTVRRLIGRRRRPRLLVLVGGGGGGHRVCALRWIFIVYVLFLI